MPVIGGTSAASASPGSIAAGGSGVRGLGFSIPAGSLENLRAALATHATATCEVPYFGDSTGFGSGGDGGPPRKLRSLLLAAGLTDGGRGVASSEDTASTSGENLAPLVSRTGWAEGGAAYDFLASDTAVSSVSGNVVTFQGKGTAIRLHATRQAAGSAITYSVDGAAAVPLSTAPPGGVTADIITAYVGGLTEGTHTVAITNTANARVGVVVDFLRAAGVVVHKQSISGISMGTYFSRTKSGDGGFANAPALAALGLQQRTGNTSANGTDYGLADAASPTARNVRAAVLALGINDQQGQTDDTTVPVKLAELTEGVGLFVRMCRQASIDPIVVVPHLVFAAQGALLSARYRAAIMSAADAHSAPWVDYNVALGPITATSWAGAPHLAQTQYDIEASFLYANTFARVLP